MGKVIVAFCGTLGLGLVAAIGWFVVHLIQAAPVAKAQVREAQATAQVSKGQGELDALGARTAAATTVQLQPIIQREKETEHDIAVAPGSDTLVDPRSSGAFYGGLCAQPWRSADPVCGADGAGGVGPAPAVPPSAAPG